MILPKTYRSIIIKTVAILFIVLFVYAAISKILDYETFTVQLAQSPLLSAYAGLIAWLVPAIEILMALSLTISRFRIIALYAAFTLMVMFTAYIFIILNFSDFIPCSCGGVLEKLSWTQHLIFNLVFIFLAVLAIFFINLSNPKTKTISLLGLGLMSIAAVSILFYFSENKMQRNNAFQRRFLPHPVEKIASIDLRYNSYYIAGLTDSIIYLGNSTAPLKILELDSNLKIRNTLNIHIEEMDLPYKDVQVNVQPPYFLVTDGNVPIVQIGNINTWSASIVMKGQAYFTQFVALDTSQFIMRTIDGKSHQNVLASYTYKNMILKKNINLLEAQMDGIFDTDGQLIYSRDRKKFIYLYYYRNEYFLFDRHLELNKRLRTIDTVTQAKLQIHHISSTQENKLNPNAIRINKRASTAGNLLFVESDRLGKYDNAENLNRAVIIDVYDFDKEIYAFSFYIYNYKQSKLTAFRVQNSLLYTIMGNYLVVYRLNTKYFKEQEN